MPQILSDAIQISEGISDEELVILGQKMPTAIKFLLELTPADDVIKMEKAYDLYLKYSAEGNSEQARGAMVVVMMNVISLVPVAKAYKKFKKMADFLGSGFSDFARTLRLARLARYKPDIPSLKKIYRFGKDGAKISKKVMERIVLKNFTAPQAFGVTLLSESTFGAIDLMKQQFIKKGYTKTQSFEKILAMKKFIQKSLFDHIPETVKKFMEWDKIGDKVQEKILDDIFDEAFSAIARDDDRDVK